MTITPEVRSFLEERRFAVLATSFPDGRIQQTVMWYALKDDQIIMNTARGRVKDQNIRANPKVSLCWEEEYKFVSINGTVSEIVDDQEKALSDIFAIARRYNPGATDAEIDERFSNFRQEERTSLVVSIDSMITNGF